MADPNFSSLVAEKQARVAAASAQKQAAIDPQAFATKNVLQQVADGTTPLQQQLASLSQPTPVMPIGTDMAPAAAKQAPSINGFLNEQAGLRKDNLANTSYRPGEALGDLGTDLMAGSANAIGMAGQAAPTAITSIGAGVNNLDTLIKRALAPDVSPEDRSLGLGAPERGTAGNDILQMGIGAQKRIQAASDYLAAPWKAMESEKGAAKAERFAREQQASRDAEDAAYKARQADGQNGLLNDLQDAGQSAARGLSDYVSNPMQAARAVAENLPQLGISVALGGTSVLGNAAVSGTLEAAGMYQQVKEQMDKTTDADLIKNSAQARQLQQAGYNMSDIRDIVLGQAVGEAAPMQFGAATLAAPLGAKLETGLAGKGFGNSAVERFRHRAAALGGEFADEFLNSGTGALAANAAIQNNVDGNQRLLQDVGEQAIQGGLVGVGMGGVTSVPGVAKDTAILTGKGLAATGRQVLDGLGKVADARTENNADNAAADADVSQTTANYEQAVNDYNPTVGQEDAKTPVSQTQEQSNSDLGTTERSDIPGDNSAGNAAPVENKALGNIFSPEGQELARSITEQGGTDAQQLANVSQVLTANPDMAPETRRALEIVANDRLGNLMNHRDEVLAPAIEEATDPARKQELENQAAIINTIVNHPESQRLLDVYSPERVSDDEFNSVIDSLPADITPENISSPEVQKGLQAIKEKSLYRPLEVTPEQYQQVLDHDTTLTPIQRQLLEVKSKLATFIATPEAVSDNVRNTTRQGFKSVKQHAQEILQSMNSNNPVQMANQMEAFRKFAQGYRDRFQAHDSQMTKVKSTGLYKNDAFTAVPGYSQLNADGTQMDKSKSQFVNPRGKGLENINAIQSDAEYAIGVYNALAQSLPGTKADTIPVPVNTHSATKEGSATPEQIDAFQQEVLGSDVAAQNAVAEAADANRQPVEEPAPVEDTSAPLKPKSAIHSALSTKAIRAMTDEQVNDLMNDAMDEVQHNGATAVVNSNFTRLDNEMSRREDDAVARQNDAVAEPTLKEEKAPAPEKTVTKPAATEEKAPAPVVEEAAPVEETKAVGKAVLDTLSEGTAALADATNAAERSARTNQLKATFQPDGNSKSEYSLGVMAQATKESLGEMLKGKLPVTDGILSGVKAVQKQVSQVAAAMEKRLQAINAKYKVVEKADTAAPAYALADLKALYGTVVADGKVKYVPEIKEALGLAGSHWALNAVPSALSKEQVATMLSVPQSQVTPELMNEVNAGGLTVQSAASQIANMMEQLLGIKERSDTSRTYGKTITNALAREALAAMNDAGLVTMSNVSMPDSKAVINMVRVNETESLEAMKQNLLGAQDILQMALLPREPGGFSVGTNAVAIPRNVNGDTWQKVPEAVRKSIAAQSSVPYYINREFLDMFQAMGEAIGPAALIAAGYTDGPLDGLNVVDRATIDSKNRGLLNAVGAVDQMVARLDAHAAENGTNVDEVPIHWAYDMDTNGRTRMSASSNPQSSKVLREIFVSTNVAVDRSNPQMMREYQLHLAQGLGIKVDKMANDTAIQEVNNLLETNTTVGAAVEAMQKGLSEGWGKLSKDDHSAITDAVRGKDNKYLHTLLSVAKGNEAALNDAPTFNHAVTFEVDGVTDGPGNAFVHYGMTKIDANTLDVLKKIGWNVNEPNTPSNMVHGETPDMYVTTSDNIFERVVQTGDAAVMSLLQTAGLTTQDDANITTGFSRAFAKLVVTPATYGSGQRSLSATIGSAVLDSLYSHLSDVIVNGAPLNTELLNSMDAVLGRRYFASLEGMSPNQLREFEANPKVVDLFQGNLFDAIGVPLYNGIDATVGGALVNNKEMAGLVNVQGIFFKDAWEKAYNKLREERVAEGVLAPNEMLSSKDENEVTKRTEHLAPIFQNGVTGNDRANGFNMGTMNTNGVGSYLPESVTRKSRVTTLNGDLASSANQTEIGTPGVRTVALSTIAGGDGTMMTTTMPELIDQGIVANNVYDGLDTRVGDMEKSSDIVNAAVANGWSKDVYANIIKGVMGASKNFDFNALTDENYLAAYASIFGPVYGQKAAAVLAGRSDAASGAAMAEVNNMVQKHQRNAVRNKYVRQALLEAQSTISHMGGVDKAYNHGETIYEGTPAEQIAAMNARVEELMAADKSVPEITNDKELVDKLNQYGTVNENGVAVLTKDQLMNALSTHSFGGNRITTELFKRLANVLSPNLQVFHGTPAQITAMQTEMFPDVKFNQDANATTYGDTIFLRKANNETLFHEAIHAGIQSAVNAHYADSPSVSVSNLETLMHQFIKTDSQNTDIASIRDLNYARNAIQNHLYNGNTAAAVNEFVAWSLANQNLQEFLGSRSTNGSSAQVKSPFVDMIRKVMNNILTMLGWPKAAGQSILESLAGNFDNLVTEIAAAPHTADPLANMGSSALSQALDHSTTLPDHQNRLYDLVQRLENSTRKAVKQAGELLAQSARSRALIQGDVPKILQSLKAFQAAGFTMSDQERHAFQLMQSALVSGIQLNPTALNGMQRLYDNVMPTLKYQDFMADPTSTDAHAISEAQEKLATLNGKGTSFTDGNGRTTQLANFIAMGVTNSEFRDIIARRDIPRREELAGDLFDKIGRTTQDALDYLADFGNGSRKAKNATQVLDGLADKIAMIDAQARANVSDKAASILGKGDNLATKGLAAIGKKAADLRDARQNSGQNQTKADSALNALLSLVGTLDKNSNSTELLQSAVNSAGLWSPVEKILQEMIGTTKFSMPINKMLQQAKNQVSAVRQKIREGVPKNIQEKFSRELTKQEWATLTNVLGRTDLQSILQTSTLDDVKTYLSDPKALQGAITAAETAVSAFPDGKDYLVRSRELAHYMMTGDNISDHLLRNATAIANLYGTNKTVTDAASAVDAIDSLTSLYALQQTSPGDKAAMTELFNSERSGLDFTTTYLGALNRIEAGKLGNYNSVNAHKGALPSMSKNSNSLVVADAATGRKLVQNHGYVKVPGYLSDKDLGHNSLSYYFTNESLTAGYTQGALQTVEPLLYGVDPVTGRTTALRGSFSLNKGAAQAMARQKQKQIQNAKLGTDGGKLMPVMDETGQVIAYEAPIPEAVRQSKTGTNTNLSELMGVWQGRQAEETLAQRFNEVLSGTLAGIWDSEKGGVRKGEYVDLAKEAKTSKVAAETWNAIPRGMQEMLKKSFKGDPVMVRRDMLDNALGYRNFSVSQLFTNQTDMPDAMRSGLATVATAIMGAKAPRYLRKGERLTQDAVSMAKDWVIIRSVTVFTMNLIGNFVQLGQNGVGVKEIFKGQAGKMQEVDAYLRNITKANQLHSDNLGITDAAQRKKNDMHIARLMDANKRMTIAPLIEAGELPTVAEGLTIEDDNAIRGGALNWVENLTNKMPKGVSNAAKLAMIAKGTPLHNGLNRMMTYGDFVAKAVLFDKLTQKDGMKSEDALRYIQEEFINYDNNPGRTRTYLESMGLTWFLTYKLKIQKILLRRMRDNPLSTLAFQGLAEGLDIDSPYNANITGSNFWYSFGSPLRVLDAPSMHPVAQLLR